MNIIINTSSMIPIYEQIVEAIKSGAVDATLAPKYSNDLYIKNYGVNFVIGKNIT